MVRLTRRRPAFFAAIEAARQNGDTPSLVRWLTLFGVGFIEVGRPRQALDFFDQALNAADSIPELRSSVMTYAAKADALVRLERYFVLLPERLRVSLRPHELPIDGIEDLPEYLAASGVFLKDYRQWSGSAMFRRGQEIAVENDS